MTKNKTILRLKDKVSAELYTLLTTGRILQLTLKKEWYQKIECGEKKEEYREIKPYWAKRFVSVWTYEGRKKGLFPESKDIFMSGFDIERLQKYDAIIFLNGYGDVPTMVVEHKGLKVKQGNERWGAEAKQFYFTHELGNILYSEPCS